MTIRMSPDSSFEDGSVDGAHQGESDKTMNRFKQLTLFGVMLAMMSGCGLVLEDPRPYPAPTPDTSFVDGAVDAGTQAVRQALTVQVDDGELSLRLGSQASPSTRLEPGVRSWDSLCWPKLAGDSDVCWLMEFFFDF